MNWSDLSLSHKLRIPLILVGALLVILSAFEVYTIRSAAATSSLIEGVYTPALDKTLNADRDLYQAQVAERTIALGETSDDLYKQHSENLQQVEDRLTVVTQINVDEGTRMKAQQFLAAFREWRPKSEKLVSDVKSGRINTSAATASSMGALNDEFEAMREILDQVGENLSNGAAELYVKSVAMHESANSSLLLMAGISFVIIIATVIMLPPLIMLPLKRMTIALDHLARGEGDLTYRLPVEGKDEIGTTAKSFNQFLDSMQGLVSDIQSVTKEVSATSERVESGAHQSQQTTSHFVGELERVTHANNEMELAIDEVSRSTTEVADDARSAEEHLREISGQFKNSVTEIAALAGSVSNSAAVIRELEQETTGIVSLLDVIKGIAEQTNLLALNAAIEAARAGEQGRGFAVVADEVRNLAGKTQQATEDINDMIARLQNGVQRAVDTMQGGEETADRSVSSAKASEASIQEISSALVRIKDRSLQVAAAIEEQTSVINDINQNLNEARHLSQENQNVTRSLVDSVSAMNQSTIKMSRSVANFQV